LTYQALQFRVPWIRALNSHIRFPRIVRWRGSARRRPAE
jgi:hypothetical protein